ncbi:hypothetical protein CB1_001913013 [Camelus ferus]|nr:hypothetical protein CB1_001913013 [Camelus ferus]
MNGSVGDLVYEKSVFWDYAMTIRPEIVYLHCHQQVGSGGTSGSADGGSANGCNHERAPLKLLCDNMKYQILSRAFYGWLAYCRHLSTVRTHLSALDSTSNEEQELLRLIYYRGIQQEIHKAVWPFLLGHYQFRMTDTKRKEVDKQIHACYAQTMSEWLGCKAIVWQRERESHMAALAKCSSGTSLDSHLHWLVHRDSTISNESSQSCSSGRQNICLHSDSSSSTQELAVQDSLKSDLLANESMGEFMSITGSMDMALLKKEGTRMEGWRCSEAEKHSQWCHLLPGAAGPVHGEPAPIEEDVQRCDRNYWYFMPANLEKLRNIIYIWQHIEISYVQGMCDLLAPLLVILDDEALTFSCFTELMKRKNQNFPHGGAMDTHFANMKSLIQILGSELFELMHQNGDYTHFYFCYC